METGEEAVLHRIMFATKGILILALICFILVIDNIEVNSLKKNSKVLEFLKSLNQTPESYFSFKNFELLRVKWLSENKDSLYGYHLKSRQLLFEEINKNMLVESGKYTGRDERQVNYNYKGGGSIEYNELTIGESENLFVLINQINKDKNSNGSTNQYDQKESVTVDSTINRFHYLSQPDTVIVLENLDRDLFSDLMLTLKVNKKLDDSWAFIKDSLTIINNSIDNNELGGWEEPPLTLSDIRRKRRKHHYIIEKATLNGDSLLMEIEYNGSISEIPKLISGLGVEIPTQNSKQDEPAPNHSDEEPAPNDGGTDPGTGGIGSFGFIPIKISIPVEVDTIVLPTMYFQNRFDKEVATILINNPGELKKISRIYGFYPIESAQNLSIENYISRVSAISILGFSFSRITFSFVLIFSSVMLYLLLYSEVKKIKQMSKENFYKILLKFELGFLLETKQMLFICWIVTTLVYPLAISFNFIILFPELTYVLVALSCLSTIILGLKSYRIVTQLN